MEKFTFGLYSISCYLFRNETFFQNKCDKIARHFEELCCGKKSLPLYLKCETILDMAYSNYVK